MRLLRMLTVLLVGLIDLPAAAAVPVLTVTAGGETRQFSADELLARHDATTLAVPRDVAYRGV